MADTAKKISPFDIFGMDPSKETEGVVLNYSDAFWIKIARAGGSNENYKRVLADKLKPFRRAIQTESLGEEASGRLLREAVAEGIVLNWGTGRYPEGAGSIPGRDGQPIPFNVANVVKLFEALPDLFADVYDQASKQSLFRSAEAEVDAGN